MRCEVCNRGPAPEAGSVAVYRVNELGVEGIWRCQEHLTPEQSAALDKEVVKLAHIIGRGYPRKP